MKEHAKNNYFFKVWECKRKKEKSDRWAHDDDIHTCYGPGPGHTNTHLHWSSRTSPSFIQKHPSCSHSLFICLFRHTHTHTLQLLLHVSALSPSVQAFSTSPLMENCSPFTSLFHILAAALPISFTAATIALAGGQHHAARPQCKESRHYPISWEGPGGCMLLIYRRANTPCDWSTGLQFKGTGDIYQSGREWRIERRVSICSVELDISHLWQSVNIWSLLCD